jgi:tetratricopeptide (TPR) repeat protein
MMTMPNEQSQEGHEVAALEATLSGIEASLEDDPSSALAHAQKGVVLARLGRDEEALAAYSKALELQADFGDVLFNLGNLLRQLGRHEDALASYDRALELAPTDATLLNNRGVSLFLLERYQEALDSYARAIALQPDYANAFTNRGNALQELGLHEEAVESHEHALALAPDNVRARTNLGNALQEMGRHEEAVGQYNAALALDSRYVEAFNSRAAALSELKNYEDALVDCDRALALRADYPEALGNRGHALAGLGRYEDALRSHEKAFELEPACVQALNVAAALQDLQRHEDALEYHERALILKPNYVEALNNRGNTLQALNRHTAAVRSYQRAIELRPGDAEAHWNEGLARLALGDYKGGWPKYEWRWRNTRLDVTQPPLDVPTWTGEESLDGKSILIFQEQGYGDAIQFVRFASMVAQRASRTVVACDDTLLEIFSSVPGVDATTAGPLSGSEADYQISLMSLPLALGITLRNLPSASYLEVDATKTETWQQRFASLAGKSKVGLVWSGNPLFSAAAQKRCPVGVLQELLLVPDIAWVSLQKDSNDDDLMRLQASTPNLLDCGDELEDFAATAAAITALDLVITVDTAVAHLAGALAKPVWVLLPYAADWRWLVDREDSPWYPSARLFRQQAAGNWKELIQRVGDALNAPDSLFA